MRLWGHYPRIASLCIPGLPCLLGNNVVSEPRKQLRAVAINLPHAPLCSASRSVASKLDLSLPCDAFDCAPDITRDILFQPIPLNLLLKITCLVKV